MPTDYLAELVLIMARLRAEGGCPWDREQTHESLQRFLVEEAGEFLDALEDGDDGGMADELGDLLLQIVFHAQIAAEQKRFTIQDVARGICEKMRRRHPHVFGGATITDPDGVVDRWEQIKDEEKPDRHAESALDGVPRHLPALHRAEKVQSKAARTGFEWNDTSEILAKIREETDELEQAIDGGDHAQVGEELGDLLFATVCLARYRKLYAEDVLHQAVRKFTERFQQMERVLAAGGRQQADMSADEWRRAWSETASSLRWHCSREGLHPTLLERLEGVGHAYRDQAGRRLSVVSGLRTLRHQARLMADMTVEQLEGMYCGNGYPDYIAGLVAAQRPQGGVDADTALEILRTRKEGYISAHLSGLAVDIDGRDIDLECLTPLLKSAGLRWLDERSLGIDCIHVACPDIPLRIVRDPNGTCGKRPEETPRRATI